MKSDLLEEVLLSLEGLHCIACVNKVEKILGAREGVSEARVNLTKKQARLAVQADRFVLTDALSALSLAGSPHSIRTGHDSSASSDSRWRSLFRTGS